MYINRYGYMYLYNYIFLYSKCISCEENNVYIRPVTEYLTLLVTFYYAA